MLNFSNAAGPIGFGSFDWTGKKGFASSKRGDGQVVQSLGPATTMNLKTVSALMRRHQADLHQRGVKSLAVFGSLARGEATPASDFDMLVEFDHPVGLFEFFRLKLYLEELTGRRVDLVTADALRPAMRAKKILSEAVHVA